MRERREKTSLSFLSFFLFFFFFLSSLAEHGRKDERVVNGPALVGDVWLTGGSSRWPPMVTSQLGIKEKRTEKDGESSFFIFGR